MDKGKSPAQFGPHIVNSATIKRFMITAKNRRQNALEDDFDFSGDSYETTKFDEKQEVLQHNINITEAFLRDLGTAQKSTVSGSAYVWHDVDVEIIKKKFLEAYTISEHSSLFVDIPIFLNWMAEMNKDGRYLKWNVAIAGDKDAEVQWTVNDYTVGTIERSRKKDKPCVDIGSLRSGRDAICDVIPENLTPEQKAAFDSTRKNGKNIISARSKFGLEDRPLLLLYKGEAGLPEWFDALRRSFPHWDAYAARNLDDSEYLRGRTWQELVSGVNLKIVNGLHLATSMRSFRSEKVSLLVKQILDNNTEKAHETFREIQSQYPICITRDLDKAKKWVREMSRGNERYGLFASSNAARLKPRGIYYAKDRSSLSPENWFLNGEDDIRSSYFLEAVASEFETQGLELDYAIVAWDADLRIENGRWAHYQMSNRLTPPNWSRIRSENNIIYLTNAYRVLLTRARQGFIIYIPEGVDDDATRKHEFYDPTFNYLRSIGIPEI